MSNLTAVNQEAEIAKDILAEAFNDNKSVNFVVKQDKKRLSRIRKLMHYSYLMCINYGEVHFNEDKSACAFILYPKRKKNFIKSTFWDLELATSVLGIMNIPKTLRREAYIKKHHPKEPYMHLWFIGVKTKDQGKGLGSNLLKKVIKIADNQNLSILIETSTLKNIPWYESFGFTIINKLDLGYDLYLMKRESGFSIKKINNKIEYSNII